MMRRLALLTALLLALTVSAPVFASAGLPKLASFMAGPYHAVISVDSPSAQVGANTFTVAVYDLPDGAKVALTLTGPDGKPVSVPLSPLVVLEGPAGEHDGHGSAGAGHEAAAPAAPATGHDSHDSHGTAAPAAPATGHDSHGTTSGTGHDMSHDMSTMDHGTAGHSDEPAGTPTYNARSQVKLNAQGMWTAVVTIDDGKGAPAQAKAQFPVVNGGPSNFYLGIVGVAMGGSILYGAAGRLQPKRSGGDR